MKILVMSCDKNQDLFSLYYYCMEKYWPTHPEIIYSTETVINPYYKTIPCYKKSWGLRLREALKQIDDDIILLTLDDIFIREPMDIRNEAFIQMLMSNKKIGYINLEGLYYDSTAEYNEWCDYFDVETAYYKASVMLNVFRKDCLYQLANSVSPWEFEFQQPSKDYIYLITKKPAMNFGKNKETECLWGIVEGKWTTECLKFFAKEGIDIEYNKRGIKWNK